MIAWGLAACGPPVAGAFDPSAGLGHNPIIGSPELVGAGSVNPAGPTSLPQPAIGISCQGTQRICLALKYVSYIDPQSGAPVVSQAGAIANLRSVNQLWNRCGVGFQMEQYLAIRPESHRLNFETSEYAELDRIRETFGDNGELLVVTTGAWDRHGTLGRSSANAWTSMPGSGQHGIVLEQPVSSFANIIAHELGHYLSLLHVTDDLSLMNPIIYSTSLNVSPSQCDAVQSAAAFFWPQMYR